MMVHDYGCLSTITTDPLAMTLLGERQWWYKHETFHEGNRPLLPMPKPTHSCCNRRAYTVHIQQTAHQGRLSAQHSGVGWRYVNSSCPHLKSTAAHHLLLGASTPFTCRILHSPSLYPSSLGCCWYPECCWYPPVANVQQSPPAGCCWR